MYKLLIAKPRLYKSSMEEERISSIKLRIEQIANIEKFQ